jgi:hypothetical protein
MDIYMDSSSTTYPKTWDISVSADGCALMIADEDDELKQEAMVAAYLTRGSTPQVPEDGVDWQGYITGEKNFGELDSDIRDNIEKLGPNTLYPDYDIVNNALKVNILKGE